jgi:alpha-tubulin suppressor-like RCC1 family protein
VLATKSFPDSLVFAMRADLKRLVAAVLLILTLLLVFRPVTRHDTLTAGSPLPRGKAEPQLVSGWDIGVLLAPDGSLWAWGGTESFLTEIFGKRTISPLPQRVGTNSDWRRVAANTSYMAALKFDGSLWVGGKWPGVADSNTSFATPRRLGGNSDWSEISIGTTHGVALNRDGSLWTWGRNHYGQLGTGTTNDATAPVRIGEDHWQQIATSSFNSFALRSDGTLWGWGLDLTSQRQSHDWSPRQIDPATNWIAISASSFCILALKANGSLWIGGQNARSAAPNYVTNATAAVRRIGADSDWQEIYCGEKHVFGRKRDGSWWVFGKNDDGQFGVGGSGDISSPRRLPYEFEPWAMAVGFERGTTLVLLKDGTLWTCGLRLGEPKRSSRLDGLKSIANSLSICLPGHPVVLPIRQFQMDTVWQELWSLPPEVLRALPEQGTQDLPK